MSDGPVETDPIRVEPPPIDVRNPPPGPTATVPEGLRPRRVLAPTTASESPSSPARAGSAARIE